MNHPRRSPSEISTTKRSSVIGDFNLKILVKLEMVKHGLKDA